MESLFSICDALGIKASNVMAEAERRLKDTDSNSSDSNVLELRRNKPLHPNDIPLEQRAAKKSKYNPGDEVDGNNND